MDWWQAALLGLIQGLTEFIPVSSTAHLRIVPALLGWGDPGAAFSAVIQLGTLAAVLAYFAAEIRRLTVAALVWPLTRSDSLREDARFAWSIAAGNLPIVVLGLIGEEFIETRARSLYLIAAMLIAIALLLAWAERAAVPEMAERRQELRELRLGVVMTIGIFQALALIPGASRSGATILGGLWMGLRRDEAARFSFLLGIPAILGAGLFQARTLLEEIGAGRGPHGEMDAPALALGLIVAALSGYASIGFLLQYLRTRSTLVFVVYRIALGLALIGLAGQGWIA
jgi:undecaprenyl-diphosphatase